MKKADKEEKLNKDLKEADMEKEDEVDGTEKGIKEESKEHPEFSKDIIKKLVADHLKKDPEYYEDDDEEEDEKEKE
jgi:hypothetical protein